MEGYKYSTAAYLRLSKGDRDVDRMEKDESNSIANQRMMIDRFIEDRPEFFLSGVYVDDGYTGTNFKRPDFKRMMEDIDKGKIDCVIVKDLSRLGRERIETGRLITGIFSEKNIRFIAINDNYDSLTADSSDMHLVMPIKTLTNDSYSRDISMKVRASQKVKRARGEFIGISPPYGYRRDPDDKNHLLPDEEAAAVVRTIFAKKIAGMSANTIAKYLSRTGVLTPGRYKSSHCDTYHGNYVKTDSSSWTARQVIRILENETYIGSMVQGRRARVNYKVDKEIIRPREEWDVVPYMHEAIISEKDFRIVQDLLKRDSMKDKTNKEEYMFSGLLFCGDCGRSMVRKKKKNKKGDYVTYMCTTSNRGEGCTGHRINESDLIRIVTCSINRWMIKLKQYSDFADGLGDIEVSYEEAVKGDEDIINLENELQRYRNLKQSLYQDTEDGLLSQDQFVEYRKQYTEQEARIERALKEKKEIISNIYEKGLSADDTVNRFADNYHIGRLDRTLLVSLVDRILIGEDRTIEIIYRYTDEIRAVDNIIATSKKLEGGDTDGEN